MIIYSDRLLNILGILMRIDGITLWPFIILRENKRGDQRIANHERIHLKQQLECLVVLWYIIYAVDYLIKRLALGGHLDAYYNTMFEREAYDNDSDLSYRSRRKPYSWLEYIK